MHGRDEKLAQKRDWGVGPGSLGGPGRAHSPTERKKGWFGGRGEAAPPGSGGSSNPRSRWTSGERKLRFTPPALLSPGSPPAARHHVAAPPPSQTLRLRSGGLLQRKENTRSRIRVAYALYITCITAWFRYDVPIGRKLGEGGTHLGKRHFENRARLRNDESDFCTASRAGDTDGSRERISGDSSFGASFRQRPGEPFPQGPAGGGAWDRERDTPRAAHRADGPPTRDRPGWSDGQIARKAPAGHAVDRAPEAREEPHLARRSRSPAPSDPRDGGTRQWRSDRPGPPAQGPGALPPPPGAPLPAPPVDHRDSGALNGASRPADGWGAGAAPQRHESLPLPPAAPEGDEEKAGTGAFLPPPLLSRRSRQNSDDAGGGGPSSDVARVPLASALPAPLLPRGGRSAGSTPRASVDGGAARSLPKFGSGLAARAAPDGAADASAPAREVRGDGGSRGDAGPAETPRSLSATGPGGELKEHPAFAFGAALARREEVPGEGRGGVGAGARGLANGDAGAAAAPPEGDAGGASPGRGLGGEEQRGEGSVAGDPTARATGEPQAAEARPSAQVLEEMEVVDTRMGEVQEGIAALQGEEGRLGQVKRDLAADRERLAEMEQEIADARAAGARRRREAEEERRWQGRGGAGAVSAGRRRGCCEFGSAALCTRGFRHRAGPGL